MEIELSKCCNENEAELQSVSILSAIGCIEIAEQMVYLIRNAFRSPMWPSPLHLAAPRLLRASLVSFHAFSRNVSIALGIATETNWVIFSVAIRHNFIATFTLWTCNCVHVQRDRNSSLATQTRDERPRLKRHTHRCGDRSSINCVVDQRIRQLSSRMTGHRNRPLDARWTPLMSTHFSIQRWNLFCSCFC